MTISNRVENIATLKAMEKDGLIKLCPETGSKLSSGLIAYYVDEAVKSPFNYKGQEYMEKYVSGCFYPYIFAVQGIKIVDGMNVRY